MFFGRPWSEGTDGDIIELAGELKEKMGGWVFHTRVDFNKPTPHIVLKTTQPAVAVGND